MRQCTSSPRSPSGGHRHPIRRTGYSCVLEGSVALSDGLEAGRSGAPPDPRSESTAHDRRPGVPRLPLPDRDHPVGRALVPPVPRQLPRPRGHARRPRGRGRPHDHVPLGPALRARAREAAAPAPAPLPRAVARRRDLPAGRRTVALPLPTRRRHRPDDRLPAHRQAGQAGGQAVLPQGARPGQHPPPAHRGDRSAEELSRCDPGDEARRRAGAVRPPPARPLAQQPGRAGPSARQAPNRPSTSPTTRTCRPPSAPTRRPRPSTSSGTASPSGAPTSTGCSTSPRTRT
jgi:hypothetical protein